MKQDWRYWKRWFITNIKRRIDNLIKTIDANTESLIEQYGELIKGLLNRDEREAFYLDLESLINDPSGELTEELLAAIRKVDSDETAHNLLTKIWGRMRLTREADGSIFADLMRAARPDEDTL